MICVFIHCKCSTDRNLLQKRHLHLSSMAIGPPRALAAGGNGDAKADGGLGATGFLRPRTRPSGNRGSFVIRKTWSGSICNAWSQIENDHPMYIFFFCTSGGLGIVRWWSRDNGAKGHLKALSRSYDVNLKISEAPSLSHPCCMYCWRRNSVICVWNVDAYRTAWVPSISIFHTSTNYELFRSSDMYLYHNRMTF